MPLPDSNTPWPPPGAAERYRRMRRFSAWLSGDPSKLSGEYAGGAQVVTGGPGTTLNPTPGLAKRVAAAVRNEFWGGTTDASQPDTKRHLPLAEDIATISSELLFSEAPKVTVLGPLYTEDGPEDADGRPVYLAGDPMPATVNAQARLMEMLENCNWHATLLAAAEISSALGSTGMRIALDPSGPFPTQPILVRVDADATLPSYRWGQLAEVAFWEQTRIDKNDTIWRHIELHALNEGAIYHGLYKGTSQSLGERRPLTDDPATAALDKAADEHGRIPLLRVPGPLRSATSIPNMLPDPLDRRGSYGRSDYTPAVLDLMSAADQLFTQFLDESEDGRGRLFIAESMLRDQGAGKGLAFDTNQRVFNKVKIPPKQDGSTVAEQIEKVQFEIRAEMYLAAIESLTAKTVRAAGYNAQTFGDEAGTGTMTATEYAGKNRRSMSTRDKKGRYWTPELSALLTAMLRIDVERFGTRAPDGSLVEAFPVQVELPDVVQATTLELATTAKALLDAGAGSVRERVRTIHPDWSDKQVDDEVNLLMPTDPLTLGVAGEGVGPGDGL